MTADEIAAAGIALYGFWWKTPFCERFRLNPRTLRHMLAGDQPVPDGLAREIRAALAEAA